MYPKWIKKDGTRMKCSVSDCDKPIANRGYCPSHVQRFRKYGDPLKVMRAPSGSGFIERGYKAFKIKDKKFYEHRVVMEKVLGRKLKKNEVVHHIDENPLNNIPENLCVMERALHIRLHHTTSFRDKTHKQCTHCKKIKPRWMFDKESKKGKYMDKHLSKCKDCRYILDKRHKGKYRWHKNRFNV